MHAVKKRGGSALLLTRCYMKKNQTRIQNLKPKMAEKKKRCAKNLLLNLVSVLQQIAREFSMAKIKYPLS